MDSRHTYGIAHYMPPEYDVCPCKKTVLRLTARKACTPAVLTYSIINKHIQETNLTDHIPQIVHYYFASAEEYVSIFLEPKQTYIIKQCSLFYRRILFLQIVPEQGTFDRECQLTLQSSHDPGPVNPYRPGHRHCTGGPGWSQQNITVNELDNDLPTILYFTLWTDIEISWDEASRKCSSVQGTLPTYKPGDREIIQKILLGKRFNKHLDFMKTTLQKAHTTGIFIGHQNNSVNIFVVWC